MIMPLMTTVGEEDEEDTEENFAKYHEKTDVLKHSNEKEVEAYKCGVETDVIPRSPLPDVVKVEVKEEVKEVVGEVEEEKGAHREEKDAEGEATFSVTYSPENRLLEIVRHDDSTVSSFLPSLWN